MTEIDEFHVHEALDRASTCGDIIENMLSRHPVINANEAYKAKVEEALVAIFSLYQMIGAESDK